MVTIVSLVNHDFTHEQQQLVRNLSDRSSISTLRPGAIVLRGMISGTTISAVLSISHCEVSIQHNANFTDTSDPNLWNNLP